MKRVIFDTNIYGELVVDPFVHEVKELCKNSNLVGYGFSLIRKELQKIPENVVNNGKKLRVALLFLYDEIVGKHTLSPDKHKLSILARGYYKKYRALGGLSSQSDFNADFLIVACASLHDLNIVVSNDDTSMLSEVALTAYKAVNKINDLKMPQFIDYYDFVSSLR
ncbi:hypothetical protein J4207_01100 [Candidatus Woesearchaeota archaeon]|nr:hypothetical protein [Candidatus Woesearchaeota archaeon]